jgi:hypothetical protein
MGARLSDLLTGMTGHAIPSPPRAKDVEPKPGAHRGAAFRLPVRSDTVPESPIPHCERQYMTKSIGGGSLRSARSINVEPQHDRAEVA